MSRKKNFEIAFQLGANMDPSVRKAFGETQRNMKGFRQGLGNAAKAAGKFALGVAGASTAAAAVGVGMANRFANTADEIDKASQRAGVHSDYLQEMRYAMDQVGVEGASLEKALQRTNQRIGQAEQGNEKYTEALDKMNISLKDSEGNLRGTEDVFQEAIDYLGDMENSSDRAALAAEFFGDKTAQELLPALEAGGDEIKNLRDEAHDLGHVIGEDGIEAGVLWADTMDKVKKTFQGFFNTIAMKVLPFFQRFLDAGLEKLPAMQEKMERAFEIVGGILSWLGETGMRIFNSIRDAIGENFEPTMSFRDLLQEAGDFLRNAFEMAQPYIEWFIDEGIPRAVELMADVVDRAKEVYSWIAENWEVIGPIVYGIVGAMAAYVAITKIVAAVVAIKTAAVAGFGVVMAFVTSPIGLVVLAIGALIAIGIALWRNWDTVSAKAQEIWGSVRDFFVGIGERIGDAVGNMRDRFVSAFQSMRDGIKGPVNAIAGMGNGLLGGFEKLVNGAASAINGIPSIDIPSWVPGLGGKSFGIPEIPSISLPKIPQLAEGGITTGATLAMIGEGAEQEAVLPLSKLESLLNAPANNTTNVDNNQPIQIVYNPHYTIEGNADKATIEQVNQQDYQQFKRWLDRYFAENKRLSLK